VVLNWIYDEETYPNCFTFTAIREDEQEEVAFEISTRKNQIVELFSFIDDLKKRKAKMVGFNNIGFDYPILHALLEIRERVVKASGRAIADKAYRLAQEQIKQQDGFSKTIPVSKEYVRQIDLFKIHHFDNKARATSLKLLEFNMKLDTIEDLPFAVGTILTDDQMDVLLSYNMHDVMASLRFYKESLAAINFREELTKKYKRNFLNHNDTKIGKDYFIMELEKAMPESCYKEDMSGKRVLNQTKRDHININECLFNYYDFKRPEFQAVLDWFSKQSITETKGVFSGIEEHTLGEVAKYSEMVVMKKKFKEEPTEEDVAAFKLEHPLGWVDKVELKAKKKGQPTYSHWAKWNVAPTLNVVVDNFRFDFGTGGIHGSITSSVVESDNYYELVDADVASMYPNIAISNKVFPHHLSDKFCTIYEDVYNQRKSYAKDTAENAMLKLALNGVYGDSNNKFSPFYDPQYTMSITINGQLSLCLLAEKLLDVEGLILIQVNTDGVTALVPRKKRSEYDAICTAWQQQVKLQLEFAEYSKMIIRDVNNYIAVYTNGKTKRKGAYQYEGLGWHQNQGSLVIQRAVEAKMLYDVDVDTFIRGHSNIYDFMLRTKVPRSSKLTLTMADGSEVQQQNVCRYYVCKDGGVLTKVMPPLVEDGEDRRMSVESGWSVKTCNNIKDFTGNIDYRYYIAEANKLLVGNVSEQPAEEYV
jgi:hypothetical protein